MKELKELVADLININASLVKTSMNIDGLADHYDTNTWLKNRLLELGDDLDKVISRLAELKKIYDFEGGE